MPDLPPPSSTTEDALLPVRAVTLFSSGVSYTLREGEVDAGDAAVALTFRTNQISDLLKSLVLLDAGGTVRPAVYPSRDPVGRTLQSFAVDVTHNRSRSDLLRQLRGAPVHVATISGEIFEGRIVGVETRQEVTSNGNEIAIEALTMLTEEGLIAVDLPRTRLLRLLDTRLDRELRDALAVLASGSDDARRTVTLRFSGAERRTVRVGYVSEAPLWKISYRLVLDESAEGANNASKPYLQGWALVENTSDDDWEAVQLSLVSGRPVSFIQDLYQPLYVSRPVVPPDIVASPFPQTHGSDLSEAEEVSYDLPVTLRRPAAPMAAAPAGGGGAMMRQMRAESAEMHKSVPTQAEGKAAGELFAYHVDSPVTLPRQQAAMIPIVSGDIEGEKLSLYNADSDARFPLNAVRLQNNTGLHLKAGPLTVFDGGIYAGDARMEEVPPGDSRLITYAVDLAVEGERRQPRTRVAEETLSIKRGLLQITRRQRLETTYSLKNKAQKARLVYVEHPFRDDWTLIEPASSAERSAHYYRFAVRLQPGETQTLSVKQEQPISQSITLLSGDLESLAGFLSVGGKVPPKVKQALEPVVERRRNLLDKDKQIALREQERQAIHEEQGRIRGNVTALADKDSALYQRYIQTLDRQENRLAELRSEIDALRAEKQAAEAELRTFIDSLEVE